MHAVLLYLLFTGALMGAFWTIVVVQWSAAKVTAVRSPARRAGLRSGQPAQVS